MMSYDRPMDISQSQVKQTVRFERPIKGTQLIDAVKATCEANGKEFSETKKYDDGWLHAVGQRSSYPSENLLVTPDRGNAFIEPDKMYTEAVVLRHDGAARGIRSAVRSSIEAEVDAVVGFAGSLQRTVQHGPEAAADLARGPVSRGAETGTARLAETDTPRGWDPPPGSYRAGGSRDLGR